LLDRTRTILEPTATVGLEPTLRGARRVPMGVGSAGRVAQSRQPVILGNVTRKDVINPVLLNHGVRSLLGVPIVVGSELLGVVHVGSLHRRDFGEDDVLRMTELAAELGATLRRRFEDEEPAAALALQRSLLPMTLNVPDGISIAARYVPAEGDLGGDWYDVFQLPGRRLGVVMGDVVGHGLDSAVIMGRLRSALRAYALDYDDPAVVLSRLDRKICHFEPNAFATVVLGIASEPYAEWRFSVAGHLLPLVGGPGSSTAPIDAPIDPLLGLDPGVERHSTTVTVPDGGFVCLFTDGLVERRPGPEDGDVEFVEENLAKMIKVLTPSDDPELSCIRLLSEVVGDYAAEDDIAVLVARREPGLAGQQSSGQ
jgi:serine phosphatase RsbU (regulator of sigma subunit)